MYHQTAIGIMDEAYFCPRHEIIKWINETLQLNLSAIEDLGTGAVYCQLLDYAFGQRVPMPKVNWRAKFEYEFIGNLKLFQNTMEKLGITRKFDIEKLSKAKYQDNLETIQWLKRYIELNGNTGQGDYNAIERRNGVDLHSITQTKRILGNSFKSSAQLGSMNNSSVMTQSFCSTTSKGRMSLKPRQSFMANKENTFHKVNPMEKKKGSEMSSSSDLKIKEIKKVLMSNDDCESKVNDIQNIIYGHTSGQSVVCQATSNLMDIEAVESQEDEVLVF